MVATSPPWLFNALKSERYLQDVLDVLNKREILRSRARASSRPSQNLSPQRSQFPHVAPNMHLASSRSEASQAYSVAIASSPENRHANRYMDIEPYDRTRVVVGERRYINANWVRELYGGKWWIAAQAPLPRTAHAFLSILLQPNTQPPASLQPQAPDSHISRQSGVRTVVQLTLSYEHGRTKAHPYFPSEVGKAYLVPPEDGCNAAPLEITLLKSERIDEAQCVRSTVHLTHQGTQDEGVTFQHLLYTAWPDHGVPEPADRASLLNFIRLVARVNRDTSMFASGVAIDPDPPIVVGCSAGVGRTGAFITICSLLRAHGLLLPQCGKVSKETMPGLPESPLGALTSPDGVAEDEVAQEIDSLREQRTTMVQRDEQVLLVYEILKDAFKGL